MLQLIKLYRKHSNLTTGDWQMTMEKLKLKDLIRAGQNEVMVEADYTYEDLPVKAPVQMKARVQLTSTGLIVTGKFHAIIEEPCDRCYEPFEREIRNSFEERYVYESLVDVFPSGDMQLQEEDFYDTIGPEGVLDLKDLVYQHLVLATSTDRVCNRETCKIYD